MTIIVREIKALKTIGNEIGQCCNNKSIYEITYNLGTKWLVCNKCLDLEEFSQDIKEKRNLKLHQLAKQDPRIHIDDLEGVERND